jgi:rhamnogalacturonyl hydrolase YesR
MNKKIVFGVLLTAGCASVPCDPGAAFFKGWPDGAAPEKVGLRIAERFLAQPHSQYGRQGHPKQITYPDVCTWYGSLAFAQATGDRALTARLAQRFEPLFGAEARLVPVPNHVDNTVFGALPLELYRQTGDARCLALGKSFADAQWRLPKGRTTRRRRARCARAD